MKSCAFYRFLLANLVGYKEGPEESYGTNYTRKTGESNMTPHRKSNPGLHHLAFSVGTQEEIDEFHSRIVGFYASHADHGRILDAPAFYPEYGLHYYAVFFTDPDGLKLELVFSKEQ